MTSPQTEEFIELGLTKPLLAVPKVLQRPSSASNALGDAAGGLNYVFTKDIALAVNAALATRRPILVRGVPGSGKSTLARALASVRGSGFLFKVVSSDSKLDDLLWRYDYVRRLQDASDTARKIESDHEYVEPETLWWALAPGSARGRGRAGRALVRPVQPPAPNLETPPVLLLDEIDKADPALPNDLLVALGEGKFVIRETGDTVIAEHAPLIVITTNDERELSRPFVRRCIVVELPTRKGDELRQWFESVGDAHFPQHGKLVASVAGYLVKSSTEPPSAAELVDLLRACVQLGMTVEHPEFKLMLRLVTDKARAGSSGR